MFPLIGQFAEGGAAGGGDRWVGDGWRSQLSLLCYAGSADRRSPVDAAPPGFVLPSLTSSQFVTSLTRNLIKVRPLSRCEAQCRLGGGSIWSLAIHDLPAEGGGASKYGHSTCPLCCQEAFRPATYTWVSMATELGWVRDIWIERENMGNKSGNPNFEITFLACLYCEPRSKIINKNTFIIENYFFLHGSSHK